MTSNSLTIIFRPSVAKSRYTVQVHENSTVQEVLLDVCHQAHFTQSNNCFLWFNSEELPLDKKIRDVGLLSTKLNQHYYAQFMMRFYLVYHQIFIH